MASVHGASASASLTSGQGQAAPVGRGGATLAPADYRPAGTGKDPSSALDRPWGQRLRAMGGCPLSHCLSRHGQL